MSSEASVSCLRILHSPMWLNFRCSDIRCRSCADEYVFEQYNSFLAAVIKQMTTYLLSISTLMNEAERLPNRISLMNQGEVWPLGHR